MKRRNDIGHSDVHFWTREKVIETKEDLDKKINTTVNGNEIYSNDAATLELSIDAVTQRFEENQKVLDKLAEQYAAVWNAEVAKQQRDAAQEYGEDMVKIMEVARRIAKGAKVPGTDEKKLMEYSMELYMSAKNLAMMNKQKKKEEYESLWEDEEEKTEYDPEGKAENAETSVGMPDTSPIEGGADSSMAVESVSVEG